VHELPITESLLDTALRYANKAEASRVLDLYLIIGDFASVVDESVQFYWDIVTAGTIAEGSRLHFQRVRAAMRCFNCQTVFEPARDEWVCPECGSSHVRVVAGNEFQLEAIEVETNAEAEHVSGRAG
jgi:hydrogenase nickel incorporation protein HypA/HybF